MIHQLAHYLGLNVIVFSLKARVLKASADTQLEINSQIKMLEQKIEEGKVKLSELAKAGNDAWGSIREGMESTWSTLKSTIDEATAKFKG